MSTNDAELLKRWSAGDKDAGIHLFGRHYEAILRFFRNKVNTPYQDDLVQRTFLVCLERASNFRSESSFRTYLFGIAHNVLREHLRLSQRERSRMAVDHENSSTWSVEDLGQSPESFASLKEEQRLLLEGLRQISLPYQVALELHYWEGLTAANIAEIVQIPLGTAKTRLRDGKAQLLKKLEKLSGSETILRSTLDNLEKWAWRIREQAGHKVV